MTVLLPDASALRHILADGVVDRARRVWNGDASWTEAVAAEIPSAKWGSLAWMPEPIEVDEPNAIGHVERLRRAVFGGSPKLPAEYLDQAQILFLITSQARFGDATWISADSGVLDLARRRDLRCRSVAASL